MYQKKIINKLKKKKILVLGDFFLDEYLYGTSDRLSPEAPAPVINYKSSNYNLGGAGNVISNLSNLFVNVIPIGFIGKDVVSKKILKIIKSKKNIKLDGLIADASFEAIKKTRLMIERTQIARLDYEKIKERISTFAICCAEKLRAQNSNCNSIYVFVRSNKFQKNKTQYRNGILMTIPFSTNSNMVICKYAAEGLKKIFKQGIDYKKAGTIVMGLDSSENHQLNLFKQIQ